MTSFFRTYAHTYETQSSSYSGEGMDAIQGRFDGYYTWGDRHYTREDGHFKRGDGHYIREDRHSKSKGTDTMEDRKLCKVRVKR